ncbi:Lpg1974 family pore-forming outer membrane protein [Legionella impletisoli]|uniref:Membrane protein n=1 Tax=Legionella impletisoli TaxID=343510 RepID=A0A917NEM9_9GAMM|nr:Lpg1974 family pore-forming outer membrane protein [Legionella impletisoli]GGI93340.1 membrane protein [Legionella impletisoli]
MLSFKKTVTAILIATASSAYAGGMGTMCTAENVTVPCEQYGWAIGAQALYLKPSYSGSLNVIASRVLSTTTGAYGLFGPENVTVDITNEPDFNWGFKLEASYFFLTGNDLTLNWYHLAPQTTTTSVANVISPSLRELPWVNHHVPETIQFSIKPQWDAVNFEFGQHADFGPFKNIRFHGGLQYTEIDTDIVRTGTVTVWTNVARTITETATYTVNHSLEYSGIGPRIGLDLAYDMEYGFGVYAKSAATTLWGRSKFSRTATDTVDAIERTGDFLSVVTSISDSGSRTMLIPELELKIGLTYDCNLGAGNFGVDLGYMFVNYFHALRDSQRHNHVLDSDFGIQGPYLGLKWVGMFA